jgi:DNA-binding NarL/FixJ family response regulator
MPTAWRSIGAVTAPGPPLRVVVGEDDELYREGLVRLLSEDGCEVVAQARDADDLRRKALAHRPDLLLTDVRMPPTHADEGLRVAIEIRRALPDTGVLVLSQYVAKQAAMELIGEDAAGVGYLLKDRVRDLEQFTDALRRVANGGSAIDPQIIGRLLARRPTTALDELTKRESEVLALVAEGLSNAGIAGRLFITEHAVVKHIGSILRKLDIRAGADDHRRVKAVLAFLAAPGQPAR